MRLSAESLAAERDAVVGEFLLFTHSNGRYRAIQHRCDGDQLIADLDGGRTYIIAQQPVGHLLSSIDRLCVIRWKYQSVRAVRVDPPRICQVILCAPDLMCEPAFMEEFAGLDLEPGFAPGGFGGWNQPPGYCELCTTTVNGPSPATRARCW